MRRPEGHYTTLADFVDVGEPLEMAVVRVVLVGGRRGKFGWGREVWVGICWGEAGRQLPALCQP